MSTCFLMVPPNGFLFAMSGHATGGSGRPPRDIQRPSRGSQSVQSVRRKLFGDVDHRQTAIDLDRELRQCETDDRNKYNFDFSSEQPINSPDSRYEWSHVSNDINDTEDKFNVSTKLCKISDRNIAQSSSQSAINSTPEPQPGLDSKAGSPTLSSNSTPRPTPSATCAPDSPPQSSFSATKPTSRVEQKHKLVTLSKQMPITAYFPKVKVDVDGRKSAHSQRKRSAAQESETGVKRHRLECSSAVVRAEDIDTNATDVTDTDVRAD